VKYISLFSGIGGLEHPTIQPVLLCERDPSARIVLGRRYPGVPVAPDITLLAEPPAADFVVGGWPCQDVSAAGLQAGIRGARSGLFFDMLRVARASGAHTIIGENVANLLTLNNGADWRTVLAALADAEFPYVAWRMLNAREFGLPQQRRRLFIAASRDPGYSRALHAPVPPTVTAPSAYVHAFYWTAGKQAICYSHGFAPTFKCGHPKGGVVTVALHFADNVRKIRVDEYIRLQGYAGLPTDGVSESMVLRMVGNSVAPPCGHFVVRAVAERRRPQGTRTPHAGTVESGVFEAGVISEVLHPPSPLATNLHEFIDRDAGGSLSAQASAGLLVRSVRSGRAMPRNLFEILLRLSADRTQKMAPSVANSFVALDALGTQFAAYARQISEVPA
jgi:DNA (cytosine-5)-methyltransferase 1